MNPEAIIAFAGLCVYTIVVWALGFHYGARALRDRNRKFLKTMKKFNENRDPRSSWYQGYVEGSTSMLNAMERFLEGFKRPPDETP
jgi:hypothetical protein